ncbi:MAG: radical SAM protein [Desulfocapsa sp.]|nr:radical SAM protein [Desulfocapsa sp.]
MGRGKQKKRGTGAAVSLLDQESGTYLKKWTGRLPVALLYPNKYGVGVSSLGFQLVYSLLNDNEHIVCERFFLPEDNHSTFRSFESGRSLSEFPLLFYSISFEHDYVNVARLLLAGGVPLFSENRDDALITPANPLVIGGGVATFMNPEPLADFTDLFLLGEAEAMLPSFLSLVSEKLGQVTRSQLLLSIQKEIHGSYVPALYKPVYSEQTGRLISSVPTQDGIPQRIAKVIVDKVTKAAHSQLLSPAAEFSNLYVTELGRGCSRGCRFCAAGFIYRPPRLWDADAVVKGLEERKVDVNRIGLLGMEMADSEELETLSSYLLDSGCSLSFSSLRADRISGPLLKLLGNSGLKSVAIAPDGASERLRRVINKNLTEEDILNAVERLAEVGLYKLKLYLMIGLPTETYDDLQEMLDLIKKVRERMLPIGKARGRLCEITLSVNCFAPKPWTPFQFHPFGGETLEVHEEGLAAHAIKSLKKKIDFLKKGIRSEANVSINHDKPDNVLFQAVLARGDRRMGMVLAEMAIKAKPWKQVMRSLDLSPEFFAIYQYGKDDYFPWNCVDHSIDQEYLWNDYQKGFEARTTIACDTSVCRRCGVCGD